jgi:hypothetical protein
MWSRRVFKTKAKAILSHTYWMSFAVCLVGGIFVGGYSVASGRVSQPSGMQDYFRNGMHFSGGSYDFFNLYWGMLLGLFTAAAIAISCIGLIYHFFVSGPVEVGVSRYFLDNRKGKCAFGTLFYGFSNGKYIEVVKSIAWRYLFQLLWTLLFLIPGIIKYYSYYMVPYILADNPGIGYQRALKLSMDMTRGHKFKIFVLQLSFIGWYLLGLICCFVGTLFVNPYYRATMAEMYGTLRNNAVAQGFCSAAELNLTQGDYAADTYVPQ